MQRLLAAAAIMLLVAPAHADDGADKERQARLDDLKAQADLATAQAALITAQAAKQKAQLDAIGFSGPPGTATLGTNGGVMESWVLSTAAMDGAARWLVGDLRRRNGGAPLPNTGALPADSAKPAPAASLTPDVGPDGLPRLPVAASVFDPEPKFAGGAAGSWRPRVILLAGDEAFAPATGDMIVDRMDAMNDVLSPVATKCYRAYGAPLKGGGLPAIALAQIGLGLLRTDTEVSGIDVPMQSRTFVAAIAGRLTPDYQPVIPSAALSPSLNNSVGQSYGTLKGTLATMHGCRLKLAAQPATKGQKAALKSLDTSIKTGDDFFDALIKPDDKGTTPLGRALATADLLEGDTLVLRVYVEKAGGSLLKRQNVWTALGFPAIGITGGVIVSYTLTDPKGGFVRSSGVGVCRTAMTDMRAVQNGTVRRRRDGKVVSCVSVDDANES